MDYRVSKRKKMEAEENGDNIRKRKKLKIFLCSRHCTYEARLFYEAGIFQKR